MNTSKPADSNSAHASQLGLYFLLGAMVLGILREKGGNATLVANPGA